MWLSTPILLFSKPIMGSIPSFLFSRIWNLCALLSPASFFPAISRSARPATFLRIAQFCLPRLCLPVCLSVLDFWYSASPPLFLRKPWPEASPRKNGLDGQIATRFVFSFTMTTTIRRCLFPCVELSLVAEAPPGFISHLSLSISPYCLSNLFSEWKITWFRGYH